MNREELRQALSELNRESAREDFTARVLERIDAPRTTAAGDAPRWAWVAAAAVVVVMIAGIGGTRWHAAQRAEAARVELARFQAEHDRLAAELAALRHATSRRSPVLLVGGDEQGEIVIDLERLTLPPGGVPPVRRTSGPAGR